MSQLRSHRTGVAELGRDLAEIPGAALPDLWVAGIHEHGTGQTVLFGFLDSGGAGDLYGLDLLATLIDKIRRRHRKR